MTGPCESLKAAYEKKYGQDVFHFQGSAWDVSLSVNGLGEMFIHMTEESSVWVSARLPLDVAMSLRDTLDAHLPGVGS